SICSRRAVSNRFLRSDRRACFAAVLFRHARQPTRPTHHPGSPRDHFRFHPSNPPRCGPRAPHSRLPSVRGTTTMASNDGTSSAFSLGRGARIGKINVGGNVAGRDVTVQVTPADAEAAKDRQQMLELLVRLEHQIANLQDAPAGLRSDAQDEIRKAREAGEQGDSERLVEKLGSAKTFLERIGQALPTAL